MQRKINTIWLGTAGLLLDFEGTKLVFDPFFKRLINSEPVFETKINDLKDVSKVFITHGHFDHIASAGWFAENQIPVYASGKTINNIIKWSEIEDLDQSFYPFRFIDSKLTALSNKGIGYVNKIRTTNIVPINENLKVEVIRAKHAIFDFETYYSRLKQKGFGKYIKPILKLASQFPENEVFGYCIHYYDKKIVIYGSLNDKYTDYLKKYTPVNLFFIPLAGRSPKNMAKTGIKMSRNIQPKKIIPIHQDNFFPPLSRFENIIPYQKKLNDELPESQLIELEVGVEETIVL